MAKNITVMERSPIVFEDHEVHFLRLDADAHHPTGIIALVMFQGLPVGISRERYDDCQDALDAAKELIDGRTFVALLDRLLTANPAE